MNTASKLLITAKEFSNALRNAVSGHSHGTQSIKYGLAISGGVDSMALAYMFRRHLNEMEHGSPLFEAYIIDHKARAESSAEAQRVAKLLEQMLQVSPEIIRLDWGLGHDRQEVTDFESRARKLRYQALGEACRKAGITHLLLGHHGDDVAETVLMRLAEGHGVFGLQGIKPSAQIPECEGMHSVYESGSIGPPEPGHNAPSKIEGGGISITRPLLSFSKARLIATCEQAKVQWVEDKTNKDPTFTKRNAARALLQPSGQERLPCGLRSGRLLELSKRCRNHNETEDRMVKRLNDACNLQLDIRSGLLHARIPTSLSDFWREGNPNVPLTSHKKHRIAMKFIRNILDTVSPVERLKLDSLSKVPAYFFPNDFPTSNGLPQPRQTIGGVLIERPNFSGTEESRLLSTKVKYALWKLCRQPYDRKTKLPLTSFPGNGTLPTDLEQCSQSDLWNKYQPLKVREGGFALWDGRFWIHVAHELPHPLIVVPLERDTWSAFVGKGCSGYPYLQKKLRKWHKACTMHEARYVIPVIVMPPGICNVTPGQIVAVPTLGIIASGWETKVRWDIRYKKIAFDGMKENQKFPHLHYWSSPFNLEDGKDLHKRMA